MHVSGGVLLRSEKITRMMQCSISHKYLHIYSTRMRCKLFDVYITSVLFR